MKSNNTNRFLACLLVLAGCTGSLFSQDYQKIQPKQVAPQSVATELPGNQPKVEGSDKILVSKLTAIVFVDSTSKIKTTPPNVRGVQAGDIELLNQTSFSPVMVKYLDQPLSLKSINSLVKDVILFYRDHDRPVVDVVVPEQDITTGVLQLVVIEGKAGEVRVEGNKWFSSKLIAGQIKTRPGEPIRASKVLDDVNWLNQNPFRDTNVVFTPGKELGTTDLVLKTEDRFPVRFYTGYEDSGNDLTGDERFLAGFNWGNAFGLGHQLNYQFTGSSDMFYPGAEYENIRAHSFSYLAPLPWRHTLNVFGSLSKSESEAAPFNLEGSSAQAGVRYTVPLPSITKYYRQEVYAGFDWKQSDNSLDFGFVPVNATTTDIGQWVFGYRSSLSDPWGSWSFAPEIVWSPGGYFGHQSDRQFQEVRPGASDDYTYFKFDVDRVTRLPWNFTLSNQFTAQISDSNLLGSEQMNMGGYSSVRGYDERTLNNTDEGWILRNELRTPAFSIFKLFGCETVKDQFQFLGFFDIGSARSYDGNVTRQDGAAVDSQDLASAGPGIRYTINNYLSVRADYGFQIDEAGTTRNNSRWHVGVIVSY